MRVVIDFNIDNAAFEDNFEDELSRVLLRARAKVMAQRDTPPATVCAAPEAMHVLMDGNGNSIGNVRLTEERPLDTFVLGLKVGRTLDKMMEVMKICSDHRDVDATFACGEVVRELSGTYQWLVSLGLAKERP